MISLIEDLVMIFGWRDYPEPEATPNPPPWDVPSDQTEAPLHAEGDITSVWGLLQEFRQAAVLEDAVVGLVVGAVIHLVFGEEDGLDRGAAARAGLALMLVDP
jgi:hypothetical protein